MLYLSFSDTGALQVLDSMCDTVVVSRDLVDVVSKDVTGEVRKGDEVSETDTETFAGEPEDFLQTCGEKLAEICNSVVEGLETEAKSESRSAKEVLSETKEDEITAESEKECEQILSEVCDRVVENIAKPEAQIEEVVESCESFEDKTTESFTEEAQEYIGPEVQKNPGHLEDCCMDTSVEEGSPGSCR